MPYDDKLAERLKKIVGDNPYMEEKKMFGGIGWMLSGNMCVGIYKEWLIIRVGVDVAETLLAKKDVEPMDITGKPMKGWAKIAPAAIKTKPQLARYTRYATEFVETLPAK